jgi:intergrase/recombinase
LTGLRAAEVVESVRLINDKEAFQKYYDPEQMALLHWKMPQFLRATKKAFLSFITPQMLEPVKILKNEKGGVLPTYSSIRHACNRRGIACNLHLCRKVFASWLHEEAAIPDITIDMLQGRCPQSVLAQHYIVPNASLRDRVLDAVTRLKKAIEQ